MVTSAKGRRWQAYNRRRATNRAADRLRREETRLAKRRAVVDRVIAEHERLLANPIREPRPAKSITLKMTLEIDGQKRVWRSRHCPGFGWDVSGNVLCEAIRVLMRWGPVDHDKGEF